MEKFSIPFKKETKKIVDEVAAEIEKSTEVHTRPLYFPASLFELFTLYETLDVDKRTISTSPREPPPEAKKECKLCMLVQYATNDSAKSSTDLQQIYVCLDFCKTAEELKFCFSSGNPVVQKQTKFDGEPWFELAKHDLGLPHKLPRKFRKFTKGKQK